MKKLTLIIAVVFVFAGCEPNKPKPTLKENRNLSIEVKARLGNADLPINTQGNVLNNGDDLLINNWGIIYSDMKLIKTDGSTVKLGDGYGYVNLASTIRTMSFTNLPGGDYKGISITLGVDSATNHADPSVWPATHPLNITYTSMHWGWAGGYIFQAIEGKFKNAQQTSPVGFSWHTATDGMTKEIIMLKDFTLNMGETKKAMVYVDINKLFDENVVISNMPTNHSGNKQELQNMGLMINNVNKAYSIYSIE